MIRMPDLKEKPSVKVIQHLEVVVIDCLDISTMLYRKSVEMDDSAMRTMADDFAEIADTTIKFCLDWGYGVCTDEAADSITSAATNLRLEVFSHDYPEFEELHDTIKFRLDTLTRNYDF